MLEWLAFRHHPAGIVLWHGDAEGDRVAAGIAKANGYPVEAFRPVQGELTFTMPTLARNEEMASRSAQRGGGYVFAFEGARGTADMIARGWRHHLRIIDLRPIRQEVP